MSEILNTLAAVVSDRAPTFGEAVADLTNGLKFNAEIEPIQDIEANVLLGRDARESVIFHIQDRTNTAQVSLGDVFSALGEKFLIIRRTDNPAGVMEDFGAMKLTDQDS